VVTNVREGGDRRPWCGQDAVRVKKRPVVAVRDLPIGGRATVVRWRKRRYACATCGRTFTETHPELYRARHRLLKAAERLTEPECRRLSDLPCSPAALTVQAAWVSRVGPSSQVAATSAGVW
jgi:transposase